MIIDEPFNIDLVAAAAATTMMMIATMMVAAPLRARAVRFVAGAPMAGAANDKGHFLFRCSAACASRAARDIINLAAMAYVKNDRAPPIRAA